MFHWYYFFSSYEKGCSIGIVTLLVCLFGAKGDGREGLVLHVVCQFIVF